MGEQESKGARAEQALIEERFRALIEWLPAVLYEAEVGPNGTFHYVSPQIEDLLGYSVSEWLDDPSLWWSRLLPEDRDEVLRVEQRQEQQSRRDGARLRSEYRMLHRDGRVVWVRDEATLTTPQSGSPLWRGVLIDVTAAHRAGADAATIDVYRLSCRSCGRVWASERVESCAACGKADVEAVSLNATLGALAASRRQVAGLLDGVHQHLEAIGLNLGAVSPPSRRLP